MFARAKVVLSRSGKSLPVAALLTVGMLVYSTAPAHSLELLGRQSLVALCVFPLLFIAFRLYAHACRQRLAALAAETGADTSRGLKFFVFYKEAIKTAVGVSLTLAWIAGLLFVGERFADSLILVPVVAGVAVSAFSLGFAHAFAFFIDLIPYPWAD